MKSFLSLTCFLFLSVAIFSQVAINTDHSVPDNSAMLDIKSSNKGLLIPRTTIASIATPAKGLIVYDTATASIQYFNGSSWIDLSGAGGNWNTLSGNIYNANIGNVGIGVTNPVAKLDIKTSDINPMKISGADPMYISLLEGNAYRGYFGSFAGNAEDVDIGTGLGNTTGKMHLTIQASPKLTVAANGNVGIGNMSPSNKLDVSGDINFTGNLRTNGSAGTNGQVLTSNGNASPTWANSAFGNTTRFSFNLIQTTDGYNIDTMSFVSANYNLNPSQVFVLAGNATRLQINKTGLYHFSGALDINYFNLTSIFDVAGYLDYRIDNKIYPVGMAPAIHVVGGGNYDYYSRLQFSFDVYITSGQILKLEKHSFPYAGGYGSSSGYINGYLVAD